ncbi:MAG: helix-turn-helix domain-containing protein [Deltaproteobacteria bacterium]|nr:MAG: helix-turn-helix domain-containing protein [Deltaproteobacteria bacterium]
MRTTTHSPLAVNTKDESFFKELGARIAQARKERNITQVQLAATLGIAQQTLAHYEGGRLRLPASLLPTLAQELQVPVEDLLGQPSKSKAPAKRGPAPRLQQHLERISALPKPRQRAVMDVIEAMLAQQGR